MMVNAWGLWWGSLEGAELESLIEHASAAGFASISTTPAMYFAARERGFSDRTLRAMLSDAAIDVAMVDPLLRGLPGACAADRVGRRWRSTFLHGEDDCYRVADALDVPIINCAHFLGESTPVEELVDAIGGIATRAAARGRLVAVEAMPEGGISTLGVACDIVRRVDHRACGLTIDTWHWWRTGGVLQELREVPRAMVHALQVGDALADARGSGIAPPSRDRLLPGAGAMPLGTILRWVRHHSPMARIGLEVFDQSTVEVPFAQRALDAAVWARAVDEAADSAADLDDVAG